jgi:hypothetical protein
MDSELQQVILEFRTRRIDDFSFKIDSAVDFFHYIDNEIASLHRRTGHSPVHYYRMDMWTLNYLRDKQRHTPSAKKPTEYGSRR